MAKQHPLPEHITPELVGALVRELEPQQHPANRGSVAVGVLIDRLLGEQRGDAGERVKQEMALKRAIQRAVGQIPELEWVDGG